MAEKVTTVFSMAKDREIFYYTRLEMFWFGSTVLKGIASKYYTFSPSDQIATQALQTRWLTQELLPL